jgi:hypothetical protein
LSYFSKKQEREKMTILECPKHQGGWDCSPFCEICEGEQEYNSEDDNTEEGKK